MMAGTSMHSLRGVQSFATKSECLCRREEGTVLTPRNVQAFRTVFNITHALFEVLGPKGWHLVLSTLAVLDEVLCSPATTTLQKATTASAEPEKHSELSVLDAATVQLFATTAFASEATVDTMMHTLFGLSQGSVEHVQVCFPPPVHKENRGNGR
jgi:hypothetical protein